MVQTVGVRATSVDLPCIPLCVTVFGFPPNFTDGGNILSILFLREIAVLCRI